MAHTKGTWHMEGPQLVGNGYGIGHVTAHNTSEGKANAALITAAPELLEALLDMAAGWEYIRSTHGDLYGVGWDRAENKARAAIARARGEA